MLVQKYFSPVLVPAFLLFGTLCGYSILTVTAATTLDNHFSAISYLGGSSEDDIAGIDLQKDKTIVIGATIPGNNFNLKPFLPEGESKGAVLRLTGDGKKLLSITRVGNYVDDLDLNPVDSTIVVNSAQGVYKLSSNGQKVLWKDTFTDGGSGSQTNGRRVAVAKDGAVAALINKQVKVYNAGGDKLGLFEVSRSRVNDISIDSTTKTVFVVGDTQKDGGKCSQLRVAYLQAYSYTGILKWKIYDWTHAQAAANDGCADTSLTRVYLSKDNNLYISGWSAGGNNIFKKDTLDIARKAPLVITDSYNNPYNTASNHIGFYAKISADSGHIQNGQFILARKNNTAGNTINIRDIKTDESGNVYISGESAARLPQRDNIKVDGKPLGVYSSGDSFVIKLSPDLKERRKIIAVTKGGGKNIYGYVAASQGVLAIAGKVDKDQRAQIYTINPVQSKRQGLGDIFYAVTRID